MFYSPSKPLFSLVDIEIGNGNGNGYFSHFDYKTLQPLKRWDVPGRDKGEAQLLGQTAESTINKLHKPPAIS